MTVSPPTSTERIWVALTVSWRWRDKAGAIEAGADRAVVAAELGDDGLLAFLHDEEAGAEPDQHQRAADHAQPDAGSLGPGLRPGNWPPGFATTRAAAEQARELAVEVLPELVEVGRSLVGTVGTNCWPLRIAGAPASDLSSSLPRPQRDR